MVRFVVLVKSLLLLTFTMGSCSNEVQSHGDVFKTWIDSLRDFRYDCKDADKEQKDSNVVSVVSCDEPDAISSYMYESKGGKKFKRGSRFNGQARITLPATSGDNGKFNFGLRYGKCIRVPNRNGIISITGHFVEDELQGRVVMQFDDDSQRVVYVQDSQPIGIMRSFDKDKQLINATNVKGEKIFDFDEVRGYRIGYNRAGTLRILIVPEDYQNLFDCEQIDSSLFVDCRPVDKVEVEIQNCLLKINSIELQDSSETFIFDSQTQTKANIAKENPFPFCQDQTITGEQVVADVRDWIKLMRNKTSDPFWRYYNPKLEPFDNMVNAPRTFDIKISDFIERGFATKAAKIMRDDTVLWKGKFRKGHLKGQISAEDAKANIWKAPLNFYLDYDEKAKGGLNMATLMEVMPEQKFYVVGRLHHGKLHGPVRMFGIVSNDRNSDCSGVLLSPQLSFVGYYDSGRPTGVCWKALFGGGWLYGKVDENGEFTGDDIAYVYPDINTAFVGKFEKGIMISAQEAEVIGTKCVDGIQVLEFSKPHGPEYFYDRPTRTSFGAQPTLGDPLDNKNVYLRESIEMPEAEEGTFAARDLKANETVVMFSGRLLTSSEVEAQNQERKLAIREAEDKAAAMAKYNDDWKYRINLSICSLVIDIPGEFGDTRRFSATLGHKLNHKFDPNTAFTPFDSPRFGMVIALKTLRDIRKDEELFVNYGYPKSVGPKWYRVMWDKYVQEHPEMRPIMEKEALEREEEFFKEALNEEKYFSLDTLEL